MKKYINDLNNKENKIKYVEKYNPIKYFELCELCKTMIEEHYKNYSNAKLETLINTMCGLDIHKNISIFNVYHKISLECNKCYYSIIIKGDHGAYKITKNYVYEY